MQKLKRARNAVSRAEEKLDLVASTVMPDGTRVCWMVGDHEQRGEVTYTAWGYVFVFNHITGKKSRLAYSRITGIDEGQA